MAANLWFIYALGASLMWGLGYVLSEKLLNAGLTPAFLMLVSATVSFPLYFLLSLMIGDIKPGIATMLSDRTNIMLVIFTATIVVGGNFLILMSVSEKNATLASLIEICYPLFTFVFAWLILREVQLNWWTGAGAMLILSGVMLIYFKN